MCSLVVVRLDLGGAAYHSERIYPPWDIYLFHIAQAHRTPSNGNPFVNCQLWRRETGCPKNFLLRSQLLLSGFIHTLSFRNVNGHLQSSLLSERAEGASPKMQQRQPVVRELPGQDPVHIRDVT